MLSVPASIWLGDLFGDSVEELGKRVGDLHLLLAFALNLSGRLDHAARSYQGLNAVGAGLAALASYWIGFWPFVVLETTWMSVALLALARGKTSPDHAV